MEVETILDAQATAYATAAFPGGSEPVVSLRH
jgi:hypothetical protein